MEELNLEDEELLTKELEENEKKRRKKKKQPMRHRTESEVREELGLDDIGSTCKVLGIVTFVFLVMAIIGGLMQVAAQSNNKVIVTHVQQQKNLNVSVAKEMFVMACQTTWQASVLWARLIMAILLPTSHQTYRLTKVGVSAMQPSISASWVFIKNAHWTTKVAIAGTVGALIGAFLLHREIKKRRYVERAYAWYDGKYKAFATRYDRFISDVRKTWGIAADILPHVIFAGGAVAVAVLARAQFTEFARGLGGWYIVIGFPVVMATRALIVYDLAYRKRVESYHGVRRRTFSHFPTPESPETQQFGNEAKNYFSTIFSSMFGRSPKKTDGADDDDETSSLGSLDSQDIVTVNGIHYPKRLEDDPEAMLEQYDELNSVVYWLQYWSVLGVALLFEQLPVTGHLLAVLPVYPPIRLIWSLWLQLPGTAGARLWFRLTVPLIDRYMGDVQGPDVSNDQSNLLVNMLYAFRLVSAENRVKLAEIMETGGTLVMVALPFFILPAAITGIGAIVIGVGRPILSATRAIVSLERAQKFTRRQMEGSAASKRGSTRRGRSNSVSISNGAVQITQWLEYWVVYTIVMFFHAILDRFLFWFPLWHHMLLVLTLWLQLPYFRGAHNVFKIALKVFYKVRSFFVKDDITRSMEPLPTIEEDAVGEFEEEKQSHGSSSLDSSGKRNSKRSSKRNNDDDASSTGSSWFQYLFIGKSATAASMVPPSTPKSAGGDEDNEKRRSKRTSSKRSSRKASLLQTPGNDSPEDDGDEDEAAILAEEEELRRMEMDLQRRQKEIEARRSKRRPAGESFTSAPPLSDNEENDENQASNHQEDDNLLDEDEAIAQAQEELRKLEEEEEEEEKQGDADLAAEEEALEEVSTPSSSSKRNSGGKKSKKKKRKSGGKQKKGESAPVVEQPTRSGLFSLFAR